MKKCMRRTPVHTEVELIIHARAVFRPMGTCNARSKKAQQLVSFTCKCFIAKKRATRSMQSDKVWHSRGWCGPHMWISRALTCFQYTTMLFHSHFFFAFEPNFIVHHRMRSCTRGTHPHYMPETKSKVFSRGLFFMLYPVAKQLCCAISLVYNEFKTRFVVRL